MKKWLPVIGYTVLAVVVYYIIDVLLSMVFGLWVLSASSKEQYYRYTLFANIIQKAVTLLVFGFWYRKKTAKSKPAKRAGICDVVSADVDLSGVSRRFCAI